MILVRSTHATDGKIETHREEGTCSRSKDKWQLGPQVGLLILIQKYASVTTSLPMSAADPMDSDILLPPDSLKLKTRRKKLCLIYLNKNGQPVKKQQTSHILWIPRDSVNSCSQIKGKREIIPFFLSHAACWLPRAPVVSGMEIIIRDSWRALSLEGLHSGFYI